MPHSRKTVTKSLRLDEVGWPKAPGTRFALRYALIAGAAFVLYGFPYAENGIVERAFEVYLGAYARVAGAVLGCFEPDLTVAGTQLIGRFPLQIAKNCDAIEANILLVAALLALPAPLTRRILALSIGVVLLAVVNVARISCLYFIGVHARSWFDFAHLELWPLIVVAFAGVEFLVLAHWLQRAPAPSGGPDYLLGIRARVAALFGSMGRTRWRGEG